MIHISRMGLVEVASVLGASLLGLTWPRQHIEPRAAAAGAGLENYQRSSRTITTVRAMFQREGPPISPYGAPNLPRIWIGHHSLIRRKRSLSPRWPCLSQASVYTLCGSSCSAFMSHSDGSIQQASATSCSMRASNARSVRVSTKQPTLTGGSVSAKQFSRAQPSDV
jgi:hypothetical protein